LIGRAGTQKRPQSHQEGYYFQMSDAGAWAIFKSDADGKHTPLASGSTNAIGTGHWHRLGLSFDSDTITASLDGKRIKVLRDNSYHSGQLGMGITSYDIDQFDNLSIIQTGKKKAAKLN
jgi:hypothetical protein